MKLGEKTTRPILARYAGLLGRGSLAAQALDFYDNLRARQVPAVIYRDTTGFIVEVLRTGDLRRFC